MLPNLLDVIERLPIRMVRRSIGSRMLPLGRMVRRKAGSGRR